MTGGTFLQVVVSLAAVIVAGFGGWAVGVGQTWDEIKRAMDAREAELDRVLDQLTAERGRAGKLEAAIRRWAFLPDGHGGIGRCIACRAPEGLEHAPGCQIGRALEVDR